MSVETDEPSDQEIIAELAAMPNIEYERHREKKAGELGIRIKVLDAEVKALRPTTESGNIAGQAIEFPDVTECPGEVIGSDVLDEALTHVIRHMHIDEHEAVICVLWSVHTYVFGLFSHTPRLIITAPAPECGKTVLLHHLVGGLSNRPLCTENISPAVYFRVAEQHQPTFAIDEADAWLREDSDFESSFNSGFEPTGKVMRCVTMDREITVRGFRTFTPIALGGINLDSKLKPAMLSRAMLVTLEKAADEIAPTDSWDRETHEPGVHLTATKLAKWTRESRDQIRAYKAQLPTGLRDRAKDKWRPLFRIAGVAGGNWPDLVQKAYYNSIKKREPSLDERFLMDVRNALGDREKVFTSDLIDQLCKIDDSPYLDWNFRKHDQEEKRIQPRQLSTKLGKYRLKSKDVRIGGSVRKGYDGDDLRKLFKRYIPESGDAAEESVADNTLLNPTKPSEGEGGEGNTPFLSATALQSCCDGGFSDSLSATPEKSVADSKLLKAKQGKVCSTVADRVEDINTPSPGTSPAVDLSTSGVAVRKGSYFLKASRQKGIDFDLDADGNLTYQLPSGKPSLIQEQWIAEKAIYLIAALLARRTNA